VTEEVLNEFGAEQMADFDSRFQKFGAEQKAEFDKFRKELDFKLIGVAVASPLGPTRSCSSSRILRRNPRREKRRRS